MFVSQLAGFYTKRFKAGQIMTKRLVGPALLGRAPTP